MKSAFQLYPVKPLSQDHAFQLKDGKREVQWMDKPFIPPSLSEKISMKSDTKGSCGNRRCKCVNVGLLCANRESDDEETSGSERDFSDSDSD